MTKDVYKSSRGKPVDMGALRLKNENERAVGNMKVNARGDAVMIKMLQFKASHNRHTNSINNRFRQKQYHKNGI